MNIRFATSASAIFLYLFSGIVHASLMKWAEHEGGNGHFYEVIVSSSAISWSEANSLAGDRGGYLATITSQAENDFVFQLSTSTNGAWYTDGSNSFGSWLGGYQNSTADEPSGNWIWVTGEAFNQFTNWADGEPNNSFAGNSSIPEDFLHFFAPSSTSPASTWNDFVDDEKLNTFVFSYIIEFNSDPQSVSAPSNISLFGLIGLLFLVGIRLRRSVPPIF